MARYAANTDVSTVKSITEIERTVTRYEATGFAYAWQGSVAIVGFQISGYNIQFRLPLPSRDDPEVSQTPSGRPHKSQATIEKKWEQAKRQRFRALSMAIKMKLEAVECGITTVVEEFLAHIVLPGGKRVIDHTRQAVEAAYETGRVAGLLPDFSGGKKQ